GDGGGDARKERAAYGCRDDAVGQRRAPEEDEARVADADLVAVADRRGAGRAHAVDERAVARTKIVDRPAIAVQLEARVRARDAARDELHVRVGAAPELDRAERRELEGVRVLACEGGAAGQRRFRRG